jgi:hypothetical protein
MKFFTTSDDKFVNLADDDQQRNLALDRLESSRSAWFFGGLLLLAATAFLQLTGHDMGLGFALFGVVCLSIAFKHESDIRTLRMVDHLRKKYQTQGI